MTGGEREEFVRLHLSRVGTADLLRELARRLPGHALITVDRLQSLIRTETDATTASQRIPEAGGEPT